MSVEMIKNFILSRKMLDAIFLAVSLSFGIYFQWTWTDAAAFIIFIWMILHPFPSKYPAGAALVLLILTPIFLAINYKDVAENLAVNAYYFLVMAVMMGVYELWNEKNEKIGL